MNPTATVFSSTVNVVKTMIGAGLLAIPFVFKVDGLVVATALIVLAGFTSSFGLYLLAKSTKTLINPRQCNFLTLCAVSYPKLSLLFNILILMQFYGVLLSYLVIIGDLFSGLLGGQRHWWILGSSVIVVPLLHLSKLDSLKYSSFLGLIAIAYLVVFVIGSYFQGLLGGNEYLVDRGELCWWKIHSVKDMISTFNIVIFGFGCSTNMVTIINELKVNSMHNIKKVIGYSVGISMAILMLVGSVGYLTFGDNLTENIILNYRQDKITTRLADFALGSMVLLSFPLLFHPCRISCNNIVEWVYLKYLRSRVVNEYHREEQQSLVNGTIKPITMSIHEEEDRGAIEMAGSSSYQSLPRDSPSHTKLSKLFCTETYIVPLEGTRFYIITWLLVIPIYVLAIKVKSFAFILSLIGATGSTATSFILPGIFGYKLIGKQSLLRGDPISRFEKLLKYCSLSLIIYGLAVSGTSLFIIFFLKV